MIKTVTKDDLIELGFAPGTARKIIHTGKLLLVNRGFNIYDNKRIGTIPASVAEELLGHASITTTIDTYSHLYPSKQKTLANKLDDLF